MQSSTIPAAYGLYQPLRPIEPPDSPLAGTLARAPDGGTVLLVDRSAVADWPGWSAETEPHLLSPLDIVRRPDGHDVVLPALTERVDAFLLRRADADAPLSAGEAVTLAVSTLRGLTPALSRGGGPDDAQPGDDAARGQWWLADGGRPVLVEGVGERGVRGESAGVCRTVGEGMLRTRLGAALRELAAAIGEPGHMPDALEWEERLFACAEPEPLTTEVLGPLRARALAVESVVPPERADPPRSLWHRLAVHADADLADAASDALTRVLRRIRRGGSSQKRPVLWAAGVAAAIVVGGLLWPTGSEPTTTQPATAQPATSDDAAPASVSETAPAQEATPAAPPPPPLDDPAAVTHQLLTARSHCADTACLATVLEDPVRVLPPGVIDAPADARSVTLIDDLGGLVVVRVDSRDGSAALQLVTVVETEDGWRIRDVHDVTDAPS